MSITRDAALEYARQGFRVVIDWWPVFDDNGVHCACGDPHDSTGPKGLLAGSIGKHPIWHCMPRGILDATSDMATVDSWFTGRYRNANVGIIPGSCGMVVCDVDKPEHEADATRFGMMAEPTATIRTGNGWHLCFRSPFELLRDAHLGTVLVRASTGHVVAPPSLHYNGSRYTHTTSYADAIELPPLAAKALAEQTTSHKPTGHIRAAFKVPEVSAGNRHDRLVRMAGYLAGKGHDEEEVNVLLHAYNRTYCHPPKSDAEVTTIVRDICAKEREAQARLVASFIAAQSAPAPVQPSASPFPSRLVSDALRKRRGWGRR